MVLVVILGMVYMYMWIHDVSEIHRNDLWFLLQEINVTGLKPPFKVSFRTSRSEH
jgi:hypothetical protein